MSLKTPYKCNSSAATPTGNESVSLAGKEYTVILTGGPVILIRDFQKNGFKLLQSSNYTFSSWFPQCPAEHFVHRSDSKFILDEC